VSAPTQSAIIVPISDVEATVASHRAKYDRAAGWGVPAHVTVLYPFMPPSQINAQALGTLTSAVGAVPRFGVSFDATNWFGNDVLYLAPSPAGPFVALTNAITTAFPEYQPYGGAYDEVTPHLTVGHDAPRGALIGVEADLLRHLPIRSDINTVALWCGSDEPASWQHMAAFDLG